MDRLVTLKTRHGDCPSGMAFEENGKLYCYDCFKSIQDGEKAEQLAPVVSTTWTPEQRRIAKAMDQADCRHREPPVQRKKHRRSRERHGLALLEEE